MKISQNSQENTCAKISFLIKLQASASNSNSNTIKLITGSASDSKHKDHLETKLARQQQQTNKLIKELNQLDGKVLIFENQLAILETVINLLKKKVDDLEAYSRRPCVLVNDLQKDAHENNNDLRETVVENICGKLEC